MPAITEIPLTFTSRIPGEAVMTPAIPVEPPGRAAPPVAASKDGKQTTHKRARGGRLWH
jgi:hypothetical protein